MGHYIIRAYQPDWNLETWWSGKTARWVREFLDAKQYKTLSAAKQAFKRLQVNYGFCDLFIEHWTFQHDEIILAHHSHCCDCWKRLDEPQTEMTWCKECNEKN